MNYKYFEQNPKILIAVSGGVDSMVLLDKSIEYYKNQKVIVNNFIEVIHINHLTRGEENFKEYDLVKQKCQINNIKLHYFEFNYIQGNFQNEARKYRIKKYQELNDKYNYDYIVLGHHKDDLLENIMMNENAILPQIIHDYMKIDELKIIRPQLNEYKQEIYNYAQNHHVKYLEDSSNSSLKYLRNKIRNELKNKNEDQKEEIINKNKDKFNQYTYWYNFFIKQNENIKITTIDNPLILYSFIKSYDTSITLSNNKILDIYNLILKNKNFQYQLKENILLIVSYDYIYIKNQKEKLKFDIILNKKIKKGTNIFNGLKFNYNGDIDSNICIPKGDEKFIQGKVNKKLNRFFIDEKIHKCLRPIWPIIRNDKNQIIKVLRKNEVIMLYKLEDYEK